MIIWKKHTSRWKKLSNKIRIDSPRRGDSISKNRFHFFRLQVGQIIFSPLTNDNLEKTHFPMEKTFKQDTNRQPSTRGLHIKKQISFFPTTSRSNNFFPFDK